jgi:hypothetical protein
MQAVVLRAAVDARKTTTCRLGASVNEEFTTEKTQAVVLRAAVDARNTTTCRLGASVNEEFLYYIFF